LTSAASPLVLDHVGIAVRSLDAAIERWRTVFGYRQATEVVLNTRQQVRVVFMEKDGSLPVKLVEPSEPASSVASLVRRGGGLHHLCFRAPSIEPELARLEALGVRVISPPQPGEAFEDAPIAFVYVGDGLNIELVDTERRARRIPVASGTDGTERL
jgi:methylmalonyl-CoA/ethylmalonyl-CoA epimerase